MEIPEGYYLIPKEAVGQVMDIIDAADAAITEVLVRAKRGQDRPEIPPEVEAFYREHNKAVHGIRGELDEIF